MKLLQVCNKLPYPATDGGAIAMNNVAMGLVNEGVDVTVFALVTPKTSDAYQNVPDSYKRQVHLEAPFIDTGIKPINAFLNLFSKRSYNLERFYSSDVENRLAEVLKQTTFDVIQLESIFVSPYIPVIRRFSKAPIILRAHNVEHQIWKRLSSTSSNILKKWYLSLMADRLKSEEIDTFQQVDGIATITDLDKKAILELGIKKPLQTIPFGLDVRKMASSVKVSGDLFHLGAMDWRPNIEGVSWLLDQVMPAVERSKAEFTLHLAGKNMPARILEKRTRHLHVEGMVRDGIKYMQEKSIMVVPLLSGGGMRVKIIEGMALGKAIISTSVGAEGISYENGKNILISDTAAEFANSIIKCLNDPELCRKLGENARKLAEERYDNTMITKELLAFYSKLIK